MSHDYNAKINSFPGKGAGLPRVPGKRQHVTHQTGRGSRGLLVFSVILVGAAALALLVGAANVVLPRFLVFGFVGLLVIFPIYILKPAWLIIPAIVFQLYFPSQPVSDLVTVALVSRALLTLINRWHEFKAALSHPSVKPLILIGVVAIISFAVGITILRQGKSELYQAGRAFVYLLWLIPFLVWAPKDRATKWIEFNLLCIGAVVSILAIVQGALGISLVGTGRVAQLETIGSYADGVTRVQIPGFVFVTFGVFLCAAHLMQGGSQRLRLFYIGMLALFSIAIVFNFGRALWFWTLLGVIIAATTLGWRASARMLVLGTLLAMFAGSLIAVTNPPVVQAVFDRITSVASEGGNRTSYGWREVENESARRVLGETYLLGVGLGGEYRAPVLGLTGFENHTRYVHNGHLSVMLKISVVGYFGFLLVFATILRQALRQKGLPGVGPMSCAVVAWVFAFGGQNLTQPDILTAHGLTLLAAVLAFMIWTKLFPSLENALDGSLHNDRLRAKASTAHSYTSLARH